MRIPGRDFLVYLAGPISGLTYAGGQDWREYVTRNLPQEIRAMSPLRGKKEFLERVGTVEGSYESNPLTSQSGIVTRDRMDCMRADALIINFLGAQRVSIGTCIEIGWADAHRVPMIIVIEKSGNLHDYLMIKQLAGYRVETLDEAIAVAEALLLPEGKGTARELLPDHIPHQRYC